MNRLVKYLSIIVKWRKLIFWNTVVMTALAVIVSFLLPPRYTATAQLLPPSDEGDLFGMTSLLGGGMAGGLGRLRVGMSGLGTPSDLMVGILSSGTVMGNVARRCSIAYYYRIKKNSAELAGKQLKKMTRLAATDEGIVRISVEAKTRELAAKVANTYVAELDSFLRHSNISRGRNMRIFIEHRLTQVERDLAAARDSLRVFQQRYRVAAVDDETRAAIDAYARLKSQLSAREAELQAARTAASEDNPYVANLAREIAGFKKALAKLEQGDAASGFGVGFGVSFERLPDVAAEFARRYRDYRILEESYATLYQQYQYASILEARDAPALTVLDYAAPPERRSFPRRTIIVAAVFLFSILSGFAAALLGEYFGTLRATRPEEYHAWYDVGHQVLESFRSTLGVFRRPTNR
ncbi:MAG: Wzz/FepE/Etk N-terminal domain-containing protein [candidate division WOR-3 bacterium]